MSPRRPSPLELATVPRGGAAPVAPRLAVAGVLGAAVFSILLLRLWGLTVLGGADYVEQADRNQLREVPLEAARGQILDRNGRPIVVNRESRRVVLDLQEVPETRLPQLEASLARTLGMTVGEVRDRIREGRADPLSPVVIADDLREDERIFYLVEHAAEFPGVDVRTSFTRSYAQGPLAAHMLGTVNEVSPDQLDGEYANLESGDRVGVSGLEKVYDAYLRGIDGTRSVEVDASGIPQGDGGQVPATNGRTLRTSIDLGLQAAARRGLAEGIAIARSTEDGRQASAGAVVALDPNTGHVLAMQSNPDFDPNIFVTPNRDREIGSVLNDERKPLLDRTIGGRYPPGSTFKPITGLAAVREGFTTIDEYIPCPGSLNVAGTVFDNWTTESMGSMDLAHALEASCDTYFYRLAVEMYEAEGSPLQKWMRLFGLGAPTNLDLPGEEAGVVPDPAWRREAYDGFAEEWLPGHSVNLSIGQGDLLATPLQMTGVYAAIANGGTLIEPRIGRSIEGASGREELVLPSGARRRVPMSPAELGAIREGLVLAANGPNGTSTAVFSGFPVTVAGKTGTAEKFGEGDMAWYCGYAPAEKPTIAACAMIEQGGHGGTAAAPVVLRVFQEWFKARGGNVRGGVGSE